MDLNPIYPRLSSGDIIMFEIYLGQAQKKTKKCFIEIIQCPFKKGVTKNLFEIYSGKTMSDIKYISCCSKDITD